jgi:hypothetical protein
MDNKIKLKSNIIKPYLNKNTNTNKIITLNKFMNIYFDHKITPSIFESIIKK